MRKNLRNNLPGPFKSYFLFAVIITFVVSACTNKDEAHEHDTYTCPMHPTVISDKPGTCPVCGMDLVRKARPGEEVEITEDLSKLIKSPNETVVASIKTIKGQYTSLPVSVEAMGTVTYDTRKIFTIPARVGGRLEKVYVKFPFQEIKKSQKLVEIYSPELLTAQREFIFLLKNDPNNQTLIEASKEKLALLGMNNSQINELKQTGEVKNTFTIYSMGEGYVMSNDQVAPAAPVSSSSTSSSNSMGMGGSSLQVSSSGMNTSNSKQQDWLREGNYVSAGQTLFKVASPSALRVELNIPAALSKAVKLGDEVMLDFGNNDQHSATIDFIQPFFSEGQNFLTLRVYTNHTEKLHIGHLVKASLISKPVEALWIPKQSVVSLGVDQVVFVKDRKVFKAQKIMVGMQSGELVEVKQGLSSADEIAENAQFLVDSESFIKPVK